VTGFYFERLPNDRPTRDTTSIGPPSGLIDNLTAQYWASRGADISVSEQVMMEAARAERTKAIEQQTGKSEPEALAPYLQPGESQSSLAGEAYVSPDLLAERLKADLQAKNQGQDILTGPALRARALELEQERLTELADQSATGQGWNATIGRFLGGAGAQLTDPLTMATLPFGGEGAIARVVGTEALLGAGQSFVSQYLASDWKRKLGQDVSGGTMAREAIFDGLIQGATAGVIHLGARGIAKIAPPRERIQAFDKQFPKGPPPEIAGNRAAAEALAQMVEDNPLPETAPAREADHIANTLEADRALAEGRAVDLPRPIPEPQPAPGGGEAPGPAIAARERLPSWQPGPGQETALRSYLATSQRLTPEALAAETGIAAEDARRLLQWATGQGLIRTQQVNRKFETVGGKRILVSADIRYVRAPIREKPLSLAEFLAANGGIGDAQGELASRDMQRWFVPGKGRLIRKNGMSLDDARAMAVEAGYLSDEGRLSGGVSESTIDDLLSALDREHSGERQYAQSDQAAMLEAQANAEIKARNAEALDRAQSDIEAYLAEVGLDAKDMHAADMKLAIRLIAEDGLDPDAAIERAAILNTQGSKDSFAGEGEADRMAGDGHRLRQGEDAAATESQGGAAAPAGEGDQGPARPGAGAGQREAGGTGGADQGAPGRAAAQDLTPLPPPEVARAQAASVPEPETRIAADPETAALEAEIAARIEDHGDMTVSIDGEDQSARAVMAELDQEREFLDSIKGCLS
jgi:hypothetical protein